MEIQFQYYKTSLGELKIASFQDRLVLADWRYRKMRNAIDQRLMKGLEANFIESTSPIIEKTIHQLNEYLEGKREQFDLPVKMIGTEFQQSVWRKLQEIPFGETRGYLQMAKEMGNEKAVRAVAAANGANGISIIVPCHRIVGANKELVGYAGGLAAKKRLLELENSILNNQLSIF